MTLVLDACLLVALASSEPAGALVEERLAEWIADDEELHAPALVYYEVASGLRYWTRKEALLKATGAGLSIPLPDVVVTAPDDEARLMSWDRGTDATPIHLRDLHPGPGFIACLAALAYAAPLIEERDGSSALEAPPP